VSSSAITYAGFVLASLGLWQTFGPGWACIVAGTVLFVAGGLTDARSR